MTACSSRCGTKDEKMNRGARRLRKEMDRYAWNCLVYGERAEGRAGQSPARPSEGYCAVCLAAISRSSTSNTNVAPGLIRGGRPLSR